MSDPNDLADLARASGCGEFGDRFMQAHQEHPEHDL